MLKLIGWAIKTSIFIVLVLVVGNWVHWRGQTLSDRAKALITRAEQLPYMSAVTHTVAKTVTKTHAANSAETRPVHNSEQIAPSERQKLRALIHEMSDDRAGKISGNP